MMAELEEVTSRPLSNWGAQAHQLDKDSKAFGEWKTPHIE